jgi:lysophospholipase L1-like esterase
VFRRLLPPLGLIAFAVVLFAVSSEVGLRLAFFHSKDFSMEMWKYAVQLKRPVADPQLSFAHIPNSHSFLMGVDVNINSQGQRDYEYPLAKTPDTYRIVMLGDSTTFGWGVRLEDTAAKILERQLNEGGTVGGRRFEVINAGVGNYDTVQEVTYYETRGRAFHPDVVILVYFINDPEPVPTEKKGFLIDRSYLVAFATNRFDGILRRTGRRPTWKQYYASLYNDNQPGFQACKAALRSLAGTTRSDGAQLLVAILPELHEINGNYPFTAEHQKIKEVLATDGVPVLDLIDGLRDHGPESTLWVTPQDDHPSAKANNLIAGQLRDWILKNLSGSDNTSRKQLTSSK